MDVDGDGTLSHREFREGLRSLGINLPVTQVNELLHGFDKDNDGEIDYHEFARSFENSTKDPEEANALTMLQKKLDRRAVVELGSRAVRMLVDALHRPSGDPARLTRAELRLIPCLAWCPFLDRVVHIFSEDGSGFLHCPGPAGAVKRHHRSTMAGAFVWARRALNG